MSSATWQYNNWHECAYDIDAQKMRDAFHGECVPTCSGAPELRGLTLSDAIGHVHPDCGRVVFNAYKTLLSKCLEAEERPLLPPPPPPVPEYGVLEPPWEAFWDSTVDAYGFFLRELGFAQWGVPICKCERMVLRPNFEHVVLARVGNACNCRSAVTFSAKAMVCFMGFLW